MFSSIEFKAKEIIMMKGVANYCTELDKFLDGSREVKEPRPDVRVCAELTLF